MHNRVLTCVYTHSCCVLLEIALLFSYVVGIHLFVCFLSLFCFLVPNNTISMDSNFVLSVESRHLYLLRISC